MGTGPWKGRLGWEDTAGSWQGIKTAPKDWGCGKTPLWVLREQGKSQDKGQFTWTLYKTILTFPALTTDKEQNQDLSKETL